MIQTGRQRFNDQQEFGDFVRDRIGMDYFSCQLASGRSGYECDYVRFADEDAWVARTRPLQSEYTEFVVPDGHVLVSICRDPVEVFCNRWRVDTQPVLLFPGGQKIRGVFPLGYEAFDILVSETLLSAFGVHEALISAIAERRDPLICEIDSSEAQDFFSTVSACLDDVNSLEIDSDRMSRAASAMLQLIGDELPRILGPELLATAATPEDQTRRADVVAAATSYLDTHLASAIQVERVATDLGVSSRLLTYAFQDSIGLSPYQFVLLKRLHLARDAIRLTDEPVGDIASRFGFSTPSRFRQQYARLFGELPGATRDRLTRGTA